MDDNSKLSASDIALLSGNNNDWNGNSFMWIFALLILAGGGFGNFGWNNGGGGFQSVATQDFIQNGLNDQNIQAMNRDILSAVNNGTAQAVNAVNQAEYEQIAAAKDAQYQLAQSLSSLQALAQQNQANQNQCCCQTLRAIDGINYNNAMNTAAINQIQFQNMAAIQASNSENTQKILDAIQGNRIADMQNQINQLQNANIQSNMLGAIREATAGVVRYPQASTYFAGMNPFCGCGCGNVNI